jgi:hypothetical protein
MHRRLFSRSRSVVYENDYRATNCVLRIQPVLLAAFFGRDMGVVVFPFFDTIFSSALCAPVAQPCQPLPSLAPPPLGTASKPRKKCIFGVYATGCLVVADESGGCGESIGGGSNHQVWQHSTNDIRNTVLTPPTYSHTQGQRQANNSIACGTNTHTHAH